LKARGSLGSLEKRLKHIKASILEGNLFAMRTFTSFTGAITKTKKKKKKRNTGMWFRYTRTW